MRASHHLRRHLRPGTVTVIVVAFLALFAVIGLTFLIASQNYSTAARIRREHENREKADPPNPLEIFRVAMADIIYDAPNDQSGVYKAVRGHGIARNMYGQHPTLQNVNAYSGVGRPKGSGTALAGALGVTDDYDLLNYTYNQLDGFVRDPETFNTGALRVTPADAAVGQYFPANPNYTYPDEHNVFLASVDWTTGKVLVPSYHRPRSFADAGWLADAGRQASDPWALSTPTNPVTAPTPSASNTHWASAAGKYKILRPRPGSFPSMEGTASVNFPYPIKNSDGTYGDVENLLGKAVPQNDSLWMDFDLPVGNWNNKLYKPLVAFLVVDLDSRINLNVAGNARGQGGVHAANQGWGPWEMNLGAVVGPVDQRNLLLGTGGTNGRYMGEIAAMLPARAPFYGPNKRYTTHGYSAATPFTTETVNDIMGTGNPAPGSGPNFYAMADFDGAAFTAGAAKWRLPNNNTFEQFGWWGPGMSSTTEYSTASRYWNGASNTAGTQSERLYHPLMFNPYLYPSRLMSNPNSEDPRTFGTSEMATLNRSLTNLPIAAALQSDLVKLSANLSGPARFRTTTISNDLHRPGGTPWLPNGATSFQLTDNPAAFPTTTPTPFTAPVPYAHGTATDAHAASYQSLVGVLGAVDLNRPLRDYRSNFLTDQFTDTTVQPNVTVALQDRQRFAKDIFDRLRAAVGVADPSTLSTGPEMDAGRWLAQLAVNIVDYIDNDDVITCFNWRTTGTTGSSAPADSSGNTVANVGDFWVFGTELNKVVINEAFVLLENDEDSLMVNTMTMRKQLIATNPKFDVKIWVELHNPLTPQSASDISNMPYQGKARLARNNTTPDPRDAIYKISVRTNTPNLWTANQTSGWDPTNYDLSMMGTQGADVDFTASSLKEIDPNTGAIHNGNSFYVAGPGPLPDATSYTPQASVGLTYEIPATFDTANGDPIPNSAKPTIMLRRLANPYIEPSDTNPYITVDVFETSTAMMNDFLYVTNGTNTGERDKPKANTLHSWGRRQPYRAINPTAAAPGQYQADPDSTDINGMPVTGDDKFKTTLHRHNTKAYAGSIAGGDTVDTPFDWLVHLDRMVLSPAEIVHVSAVKPHELTRNFVRATSGDQRRYYTADWFNDQTRLFRAFDLFTVGQRIQGMGDGWRVPGKININTVSTSSTDTSVLSALLNDTTADRGSNYTAAAGALAQRLNELKYGTPTPNPKFYSGADPVSNLATGDRPFYGSMLPIAPAASGQYPGGINASRTIFGSHDPAQPNQLFVDKAAPESYGKYELLQTVMNNITTRSNTFAVYATIGYFEVEQAHPVTGRPVLGAELTNEAGGHDRHRFFAIIDRTNLSIADGSTLSKSQGAKPVSFSYEPVASGTNPINVGNPDPAPGTSVTVSVPAEGQAGSAVYGYYDGAYWMLGAGSQLMVDYNPDIGGGNGAVIKGAGDKFPNVPATDSRSEIVTLTANPVYDPIGKRAFLTFSITRPHARGASMLLQSGRVSDTPVNIQFRPGNPGPQPNFNWSDPRYRPVVPVVEQLQ
jgi:hypothetical protein